MSVISDETLLENLKKYFKHSKFKSEVQKNAIKNILQGNFSILEHHERNDLLTFGYFHLRKNRHLYQYANWFRKISMLSFTRSDAGQ